MAKQVKQTFNPQKNYKWEPSDSFDITGQEFASLYHCLSQAMNTPGGSTVALTAEAYGVIIAILSRGVQNGTVEEADLSPQINQIDDSVKQLFNK